MKRKIISLTLIFSILAALLFIAPERTSFADEAEARAVTVDYIDYDLLNMRIHKNGNSVVSYAINAKSGWKEVEARTLDAGDGDTYYLFDISAIPSSAATTLYFKGDKNTTILTVKLPKQNTSLKVKYDKAANEFTFSGADEATTFMWRKQTDYNWQTVYLPNAQDLGEEGVSSYESFRKKIESFMVKGAKIRIRTAQTNPASNNGNDPGQRPSKEVVVAIPKRTNAPTVKLNVKKMTLNTKTTMEYYDGTAWVDCEKNMSLADIAPQVFYKEDGSMKSATIKFRVAATDKKPCSKTFVLNLPAQGKGPTVGSSGNVKISTSDGKLILEFADASKESPIEYCLVKDGADIDKAEKVSWKTVKAAKTIKLSDRQASKGAKIYFRFAGINANANKGIEYKLPSAATAYTVN